MTDFCHAFNIKISARKNDIVYFNYSIEHCRVYITSPIENKIVHCSNNLRDVLGFKRFKCKSAGTLSRMKRVIFVD